MGYFQKNQYLFAHKWQVKVFSLKSWTPSMWVFTNPFVANLENTKSSEKLQIALWQSTHFLSQYGHSWTFLISSGKWVNSWLWSDLCCLKVFPHVLQIYEVWAVLCLAIICFSIILFELYLFLHKSHLNGADRGPKHFFLCLKLKLYKEILALNK